MPLSLVPTSYRARRPVPLDLKAGNNTLRFSGVTAQVEPDSVILRDPTGRQAVRVLEQNYRNDPVSQGMLLGLYEGKTIEFRKPDGTIVSARIVRSGYVPHYQAMNRYGSQYQANQMAMASGGAGQPIIEVSGQLQFTLPGNRFSPPWATTRFSDPRSIGSCIRLNRPGSTPS